MKSKEQILPDGYSKTWFYLGWICIGAVLAMIFTMGLVKIYSNDFGFHLKSAEWIITHKQFISTDTFTYPSAGNKYYDLQWLYQIMIYSIYTLWNAKILIITNAFLITFSFVLIWIRFFKSNKTFITKGNILFAVIGLLVAQSTSFEIRPHVMSWIFLNLILLILESYKRGNQKSLFLLPVITIVWINMHSIAILSLVTISIYVVGIWLETGIIDKKLIKFGAFSFAAFLINPYFFEGLLFPFQQFNLLSGENLKKEYVGELQNPLRISEDIRMLGNKYLTHSDFMLHMYLIIAVVAILIAIRKKHYTNLLLLIAYFVLVYLGVKNYGFFVVVSLPLVITYLLNPKKNGKPSSKVTKPVSQPIQAAVLPNRYKLIPFATILLAALVIATTITDGYAIFRHSPYRFGFSVDSDILPVGATAYLQEHKIKGKILNHLDFGSYLMANYPEKVFIDGRMELLEEGFFKKYFESLHQKNGFALLLKEFDPDIVTFPYSKALYWWRYFLTQKENSGYKPVYFDGVAVIYVKSVKYPEITDIAEKNIFSGNEAEKIKEMDELLRMENKPGGFSSLVNGIWLKQQLDLADQNKATYCFTNGFTGAALNYSIDCIKKSTVHTPNIFYTLSAYYTEKGKPVEAGICNDKSE